MRAIVILSVLASLKISLVLAASECWRMSYGRGVGTPLSGCPDGWDNFGLYCSKPCQDGYKNIAGVCIEKCDDGYTDLLAGCTRGFDTYGLGCCCIAGWPKKCCKKDCKSGYKKYSCVCERNADFYVKDTYVPSKTTLKCDDDQDQDGLLCYKQCRDGFEGNGPVCWKKCEGTLDTKCGMACVENAASCVDSVIGKFEASLSLLTAPVDPVGAALDVFAAYGFMTCTGDLQVCYRKTSNGVLKSCTDGEMVYECGLLCSKNKKECELKTTELILDTMRAAADPEQVPDLFESFNIKICN